MNFTPALLPCSWHRYHLTTADIKKLQQQCDGNLFYQHLVYYLFYHRSSIERLLDVHRDNRSIFSFRCGNSKNLFNLFMPLYAEYMSKQDSKWPYTMDKLTYNHPLHDPPLPCLTLPCSISKPLPMPSPFRQMVISAPQLPHMIKLPNDETLPFYPIHQDKDKLLMIRLHDVSLPCSNTKPDSSKTCIVNMPCYIHYQANNTTYLLGYESFMLQPK
jgi:hypothetical protein